VWHFQLVRHGLWDYDLPAAPNLVDVTVNGRRVRAVAQVSKQGFVYVFDRATGQPVWPIEDRPVPQSTVAGEKTARTQPFPTKPAPFERQGLTTADVIDFTPELRTEALAILAQYDHGPLFTPPSERGTALVPGIGGGASWAGGRLRSRHGTAVRDIGHRPQRRETQSSARREPDQGSIRRAVPAPHGTPGLATGEASLGPPHRHRPERR
jgi:quinoprotein glucose dehydrogenase